MGLFLHKRRRLKRGFLYQLRWGIGFIVACSAVSCHERIEVELSTQAPVLVVEGGITTDSAHHVIRLTRTIGYLDTALQAIPVSGAEVSVWEDSCCRRFAESDCEAGVYCPQEAFAGKPGALYRLEIRARVKPSAPYGYYTAQEIMPSRIYLDSVTSRYGRQGFGARSGHGWSVLLYATDPPEKNYYGFSFYVDGRNYNDSLRFLTLVDDVWGSGEHLNGVPVIFFRSGKPQKMPVHAGSTVTIKVASYTAGYFHWLEDLQALLKPSVPVFSAAPANLRGNVSNGAFGYFAVYSVARDSTVLSARDSIEWRRQNR
ncbi:MAG: DUF4249 domain-containing protein [Bacteroidales bacterium]|nr:DUF4249 domain-containing protein [Bacteroidales bacterium]